MLNQRIGSPNHSINQLVESIGTDTRDHESDRLRLLLQGPVSVQMGAYSSTIRDAAKARLLKGKEATNYGTTKLFARVYQKFDMAAQQGFGSPLGSKIPWHESWMPTDPTDNDRMVTIIDNKTGRSFNCWMVDRYNLGAFWHIPNHQAGFNVNLNTHLAMASMTSPDQSIFTMEDYESGGALGTHGAKIHALLGVVRAWEVAAGAIEHAISISISRPAYGTWQQSGGTKKLIETVPARLCGPIELEHKNPVTLGLGGVTKEPHPLDTTLPSGHRMVVDISDAQILELLARHFQVSAPLYNTARIFTVAMREYGLIVLETNAYGIGVQTEGWFNPAAKKIWAKQGLTNQTETNKLNTYINELIQMYPWKTVNERNVIRPDGVISKTLPPYKFK